MPSGYERLPDGRHVRKPPQDTSVIDWCVDNIKGEWTWGGQQSGDLRPIYIKDKNDAMMFKLTWFDHTQKPKY
jgi:hypothetical protein